MLKTTKATIAGLIFGLAFGAVAFAQQPTPQTQNPTLTVQQGQGFGQMARRRALRRRAMMAGFRVLHQLNLTEAQKQQARTIIQSNFANTQATRQESAQLRGQWRAGTLTPEGLARAKELRKQLREARMGVRSQLAGILTPDQKAKLEEIIKTRRTNHGMFGPRRQMPNKPL